MTHPPHQSPPHRRAPWIAIALALIVLAALYFLPVFSAASTS
jgi:hypothetical protein